jgi:hypothetical protein
LRYLQLTKYLPLTLEADWDLHIIKWWVDASYGTHPDMKSHTGATMSLGKGAVYSTSTRQKLNTISSTEAELVGIADVMPMVIWTRYFLEGQGYKVTDNIVYQDNKSTMLLAKNGKASSGKRTKHINIRYFFVAARIKSNELTVEYCPTVDMTGDLFTKPLQGVQFIKFRKDILNLEHDDLSMYNIERSQECVGINKALQDGGLRDSSYVDEPRVAKASSCADEPRVATCKKPLTYAEAVSNNVE